MDSAYPSQEKVELPAPLLRSVDSPSAEIAVVDRFCFGFIICTVDERASVLEQNDSALPAGET